MEELLVRLATFCENREISRFSPEEMQQLLEDGETVEWIVGQVLPEGPEEAVRELGQVLGELAAQVGPAPSGPEPEEMAPELDWEELARGVDLPPGVDLGQVRDLMSSPRGALLADFGAFCEERGLASDASQEEMNEAVQQLQEEWLQTPREALEGKRPAEMLEGGRLFPAKVETFRREGPKVGRNDLCPCGSGRKYKKCCGKGV